MEESCNPVYQIVQRAIETGGALTAKDVRELRAKSKKAVVLCKSVFWVGIALFNTALWVPLPFEVNRTLLYAVALVSLVTAVVVPLVGLKKHQLSLELLKVSQVMPKKKTVTEKGRSYIDQVRKQDRPFINVEVALLQGGAPDPVQRSADEQP